MCKYDLGSLPAEQPRTAFLLRGVSVLLLLHGIVAFTPGIAASQDRTSGQRRPAGTVEVDVRDVGGRSLPAWLEFRLSGAARGTTVDVPEGRRTLSLPAGAYTVYVHVLDDDVPILVDVQELTVEASRRTRVTASVLEGAAGRRSLSEFDWDGDQAIDTLEVRLGTNPRDARSVPGQRALIWTERILADRPGWYRGELHAHSSHGRGQETVAELIQRAERMGLDFLAITDRNTLDAAFDSQFKSDSVVLIPALEWGTDEKGVALIYAPGTFPWLTRSHGETQALVKRVQAQGGIFAISQPFFPTSTWQWRVQQVNAIEVWCRPWRGVPPTSLARLSEGLRRRDEKNRLMYSIAEAAATPGNSANGQASIFWDRELSSGQKIGVIGGSNSASPKVPMATPVTYVYAYEKSLRGILDGLRRGRTSVSRDVNAPKVEFTADVLNDGTIDTGVGGFVPTDELTRFLVRVIGGKGKRLDVLLNGLPIRAGKIELDDMVYNFLYTPEAYAALRVRVFEQPSEPGFGAIDLLAMSSPIYAQGVLATEEEADEVAWVEIESDYLPPEAYSDLLPLDPTPTEVKVPVLNQPR